MMTPPKVTERFLLGKERLVAQVVALTEVETAIAQVI